LRSALHHAASARRRSERARVPFRRPQDLRLDAARGEFLESAEVHGNRYVTSRKWIAEARAKVLDIVLEIDWQGAQQVRKAFPDAVGIFILPPPPVLQELERRLRGRGQDSEEAIQLRLRAAREEIGHVAEFDYVIINKEFEEARRDLAAVVRASRLMLSRQSARHPEIFRSFS
jgi:guanylate kinase